MSAKNEWGLTPQLEKFAQAVASGKSLSDAYRASYKVRPTTKPESVNEKASALAADVKVQSRVRALQAIGAEIAGLDAAKIAAEIARVAHSDIAGIMHPDGRVKLPHELDPATRAAVSSFKIDEYGRIEYKFWDKNTALTNGAKIVGLFREDNKQKTEGAAEFLAALRGNVLGVVKDEQLGDDDDE
jgi:phage terminase small subunit